MNPWNWFILCEHLNLGNWPVEITNIELNDAEVNLTMSILLLHLKYALLYF